MHYASPIDSRRGMNFDVWLRIMAGWTLSWEKLLVLIPTHVEINNKGCFAVVKEMVKHTIPPDQIINNWTEKWSDCL